MEKTNSKVINGIMKTLSKEHEQFRLALKDHVDREGHGTQTQIANSLLEKKMQGTSSLISQIIAGKKKASLEVQAAIAEIAGYSYVSFLNRGEKIAGGQDPGQEEEQEGKAEMVYDPVLMEMYLKNNQEMLNMAQKIRDLEKELELLKARRGIAQEG